MLLSIIFVRAYIVFANKKRTRKSPFFVPLIKFLLRLGYLIDRTFKSNIFLYCSFEHYVHLIR